jgi:hypothetical protein
MDRTRALGRSIRDNPVAMTLVGVGLGWLLVLGLRNPDRNSEQQGAGQIGRYGRGRVDLYGNPYQPRSDTSSGYGADLAAKARAAGADLQRIGGESEEAFRERVDMAKGAVLGVARQAGEAAAAFRDRIEQALSGAAEQARRMGDQAASIAAEAGDAVADAAGRAGAMAGELAGRGRAAAEGAWDGASQAGVQARSLGSRTTSYLQEQPLLLGALGVVAGAALGLLLPSSRSERRMLGEAREGVRGSAQASVRAAGQQIANAAGRVRAVVEETASAGHEAVQRELSATEPAEQKSSDTSPGSATRSAEP